MDQVIYWTPVCGNKSAFWDFQRTINNSNPDLTECFEQTVLPWAPCAFLWICAPFYAKHLCGLKTLHSCGHSSALNLSKLVIGLLLVLSSVLDIFRTVSVTSVEGSPELYHYLTPALTAASLLVASVFILWEFRVGIISSGVLFLYWLLLLVTGILPLRTHLMRAQLQIESDLFKDINFYVFFALSFLQFLLHLFGDTAALDSSKERQKSEEEQPLIAKEEKSSIAANENTATNPCPEYRSSFINRTTFSWITGLIVRGYKNPLQHSDLWDLNPSDECKNIVPRFEKAWKKQVLKYKKPPRSLSYSCKFAANGSVGDYQQPELEDSSEAYLIKQQKKNKPQPKQPSLFKAIASSFGPYYMFGGFFKFIYDLATFAQPQLLNILISYVTLQGTYPWQGYVLAASLFVVQMFRTYIMQYYQHVTYLTGMRIRTGVIALVYRKALQLSNTSRKESTVGEIVNLMSIDAQKLQEAPAYLHMLWSAPLTIGLAMYFLWQILGPATLSGLAIMILMVPLNAVLAQKIRKLQVKQLKFKDNRIKMMNELLNGMKVLKLYGWEGSFQEKILDMREDELHVMKIAAYLNAFSGVSWYCAPFLVALSSFGTYVLSSPTNILDANKAFVSLSLFNIMSMPMSLLPAVIAFGVQAVVSIGRIGRFLNKDELDESAVQRDKLATHPVMIEKGEFTWDVGDPPILKDINLEVKDGSLIAVVGTVGSGKSSLVSAILGEMEKMEGSVRIRGSTAYVPQQAWIQNATLKDNILFGKEHSEKRYKKIIEACALTPDIKILPGGDQTEIGEKGINLSGGQKQRISLARACYNNADIYLLDDPLSAVDAHVGKHIFDKVVGPKGMLAGKTRLLVTHGIGFLPQVDQIVVMTDGHISEYGTYEDLLESNGAFAEFIRTYLNEEEEDSEPDDDPDTLVLKEELRRRMGASLTKSLEESQESQHTRSAKTGSTRSGVRRRRRTRSASFKRSTSEVEKKKDNKRLTYLEKEETGAVKLSVFVTYMKAVGIISCVCAALAYVCYMGFQVGTNIWLSVWSNDPIVNGTQNRALTDLRLGVYGGLGLGQAICTLVQSLSISIGCIYGSRELHTGLLVNILHAPLAFFDTTPLGRILNRFAKDIDTLDTNIPITLRIWMATLAGVVMTLVVISYSTPIFIAVIVPLFVFYFFVQRFYIASSRQLKRIDSVRRSPIYSHFGETVMGVSSIRAYRVQDTFIGLSDYCVDNNQKAWFPNIVSNRWMGIWLETIGNFIVLFAALFAVIQKDSIDGGLVGLSVSYSLSVTGNLNYMVRMTCDLENYIVAVERIKEYCEIVSEAAWFNDDHNPEPGWPAKGQVNFNNYSMRYRPGLDLVLKDINAEVKPGEKVGIVGRTGAGKSSLTLALFRIIEAAEGKIVIDDVNIADIGLHVLRSRVTIIPQDPVLFSGTLKMNLDPFNKYSDGALWKALEQSNLKTYIASLPEGLQYMCSEGGDNLSVGQRQLVCLARALLRKSKILVLDEATAAVDLETDDYIQNTIRNQFKGCTVITIAHRLNTILDYDRVMVLDAGQIKEYDTPKTLLEDKKTIFHSMARDAGLV